ncbi:hypothetical protein KBG31_00460 [Patescibacteria group bacterium]|nr:hypothetical protein [Patescibacteria group bacterium]
MKIPVIVGPTSTGKTGLALEMCKKLNGQIISADSRQIYRHMDVGTGKIPLGEKEIIKHEDYWEIAGINVWGYDIVNPGEYYSAYDFALFALERAKKLIQEEKMPFLVGGTGLYIDFFTQKIQGNSLPPDFNYRKSLEKKNLQELQNLLTSLNLIANTSDFQNKHRLVRIIERNRSAPKIVATPLPHLKNVKFVFIGLTAPRDFLYNRADLWVDSIWKKDKIVLEVEKLSSLGFINSVQLNGFIYSQAIDYKKGVMVREEAIQKTKFAVHSYIRRQETYFKKNSCIQWFDISKDNLEQTIYNYFRNVEY